MATRFTGMLPNRVGAALARRASVDRLAALPLLGKDDPLGTAVLATHRVPLEEAPAAYDLFREKRDGCIKVLFRP